MRFFILLFTLYLIVHSAISQDTFSFMEIGIGYTYEPNSKSAINFSFEKKFKKIDLFSFQLDYSAFKINGGSQNYGNRARFLVTRQHVSASVKWYPIKSTTQPFSLLFIGLGPGYYKQWFADILVDDGPSLNFMLGGTYIFNNGLRVSLKTEYFHYYNFIQEKYKFNVYLFTVGVGIRIIKKN